MTRQVVFTGEKGAVRFASVYEMFLTGCAVQQQGQASSGEVSRRRRDLAQMRVERTIGRALNAISTEGGPLGPGGPSLRVLPVDGTLQLPQDAHTLLVQLLESAAPLMAVARTEDTLDALDIVLAATTVEESCVYSNPRAGPVRMATCLTNNQTT